MYRLIQNLKHVIHLEIKTKKKSEINNTAMSRIYIVIIFKSTLLSNKIWSKFYFHYWLDKFRVCQGRWKLDNFHFNEQRAENNDIRRYTPILLQNNPCRISARAEDLSKCNSYRDILSYTVTKYLAMVITNRILWYKVMYKYFTKPRQNLSLNKQQCV